MNQNEVVSIITPSFNTGKYILDTIKSVQNQTYENWEMLIVDDCSTDNTKQVLDEINDDRIKIFYNKENKGAAYCRNKALRLASGQWIAFLDSDDLWYPNKLESQLKFMKTHDYHFSYTKYCEINQDGNDLGRVISGPRKITKFGMYNYCWLGCLTVMYDASMVGLVQIENIKKNNDYAMWLKICKKAECYLLNECLAQYRKGRIGSVSTQSVFTMIWWHYKLYHEAEKMGVFRSIINTGRNLIFGFYKKLRYVQSK